MKNDPAAAAAAAELRWRSSVGCMVPLGAFGALFFAWLAVNPHALETSDARGGEVFRLLAPAVVGGVNLPFLLVALWLVWEIGRSGWRWADEVAATASPQGLRFHPSLFRRPLAWTDVGDVRFERRTRGQAIRPCVVVTPRHGRRITILPVDNDRGRAERFAELARSAARSTGSTR